jgi:hypothetical protein
MIRGMRKVNGRLRRYRDMIVGLKRIRDIRVSSMDKRVE